MAERRLEQAITELAEQLAGSAKTRGTFPLMPQWWQQVFLDLATKDEDFRVQMLRFTDVLPTLRSDAAIADHAHQYFHAVMPQAARAAFGLVTQPALRPWLAQMVRQGVFAMADRFIVGESPESALPRIHQLASAGMACTVDLLGEATLSEAEADAYLTRYCDLLETLAAHRSMVAPSGPNWENVLPINVSIKLSALSSHFEPAAPEYVSAALRMRLRKLVRAAQLHNASITVDMEQFRYKDLVHRTFADLLLEEEFATATNLGIVVQAYLRDAVEDLERLRRLAQQRKAPFGVRLVRGAYWDEERIVAAQNSWSAPVFEDKAETDASYERCTDVLLGSWPHLHPAFGTHNPRSIAQAMAKARNLGLSDGDLEFQLLYGLAPGLAAALAKRGYRTRVYAPIGAVIPGMAYLVRRLLENTSSQAWFRGGSAKAASKATSVPSENPPHSEEARFQNAAPARFFEEDARKRMASALARVQDGFGGSYPLLVGGRRILDRDLAEVRYPAEPDALLGLVAQATPADVEQAVYSAARAFPGWRDRPVEERARVLRRAADLVEQRRFELAATMVYESGKPWHEADGDVVEAIDYLRYYADQAEQLMPASGGVLEPSGEQNQYLREARGIAAVIAPWNFPLAILTGMTVAALAVGNAAILKPAGPSPIIAAKLVELLHQAGVPPEVVQYLPGPGGAVGQALVEHPAVDIIAFTGSNAVGLSIIASAAQIHPGQRDIKRVIAELGGKNAVIIDDDADLDQAIADTVTSAFGYAGQKCSACSRLVVVGSAYQEAVERLKGAVLSLVVGPPHDPATFVPPVISAAARQRILDYVESGKSAAKLLAQGRAPEGPGHYVPPTVFTDVPRTAAIACEEIFGPVLSVFYTRDFEEALEIAGDSAFALTGGLFSRNPRHISLARREFRVGNLYINRRTTGAMVGRQPFGGFHMSGEGEKAGGPDYLRQFTIARTITENTMRRGFAPQ